MGSAGSVARPVGGNRIEPLLLVSDRFGRSCAETRIDARGGGPLDRGECDNGEPGAGLDRWQLDGAGLVGEPNPSAFPPGRESARGECDNGEPGAGFDPGPAQRLAQNSERSASDLTG